MYPISTIPPAPACATEPTISGALVQSAEALSYVETVLESLLNDLKGHPAAAPGVNPSRCGIVGAALDLSDTAGRIRDLVCEVGVRIR